MADYTSPNPWHGHNRPWEEFKWDMRHPAEMFRAGWAGMMGRNPDLTPEERMIGFALMAVGALQIALGLAVLVLL